MNEGTERGRLRHGARKTKHSGILRTQRSDFCSSENSEGPKFESDLSRTCRKNRSRVLARMSTRADRFHERMIHTYGSRKVELLSETSPWRDFHHVRHWLFRDLHSFR